MRKVKVYVYLCEYLVTWFTWIGWGLDVGLYCKGNVVVLFGFFFLLMFVVVVVVVVYGCFNVVVFYKLVWVMLEVC